MILLSGVRIMNNTYEVVECFNVESIDDHEIIETFYSYQDALNYCKVLNREASIERQEKGNNND